MFTRKQNKLAQMIERYLVIVEECVGNFRRAMQVYQEKGLGRNFDQLIEKTHISESLADDIREEIDISLYEKYLIPDSRGDILRLLESTDDVLEKVQSVLYQIQAEMLRLPELINDDFQELVTVNLEAFEEVVRGIRRLLGDIQKVKDSTAMIDKQESASDRLERAMIKKLFASDIEIGQKILLKELILETGNISDLSESVADQLNIIVVKRLV